MHDPARRFLVPESRTHRKYEALRALFVEGASLPEAARQFGTAVATLRNLRPAFLREPGAPFFQPNLRGKPKPSPGPDRNGRIAAPRKAENVSATKMAETFSAKTKLPVSEATVALVLKRAGFGRLRRPEERSVRAAATTVQRELDLTEGNSVPFASERGGIACTQPMICRSLDPLVRGGRRRPLTATPLRSASRHTCADASPTASLIGGCRAMPR